MSKWRLVFVVFALVLLAGCTNGITATAEDYVCDEALFLDIVLQEDGRAVVFEATCVE